MEEPGGIQRRENPGDLPTRNCGRAGAMHGGLTARPTRSQNSSAASSPRRFSGPFFVASSELERARVFVNLDWGLV